MTAAELLANLHAAIYAVDRKVATETQHRPFGPQDYARLWQAVTREMILADDDEAGGAWGQEP